MKYTRAEMSEMTREKEQSKKTADRLVMDELLEMGLSYSYLGTHYLHETIVISTRMKFEDFPTIKTFCTKVGENVVKKYGIGMGKYCAAIEDAIERAFFVGNIDYLLETFKGSYDKDKMKVTKNVFIMTMRRKIMDALAAQETHNATQLRLIIQGSVEGITDCTLLKGICDIVLSAGNRTLV